MQFLSLLPLTSPYPLLLVRAPYSVTVRVVMAMVVMHVDGDDDLFLLQLYALFLHASLRVLCLHASLHLLSQLLLILQKGLSAK
jgi:hypothetical protein